MSAALIVMAVAALMFLALWLRARRRLRALDVHADALQTALNRERECGGGDTDWTARAVAATAARGAEYDRGKSC